MKKQIGVFGMGVMGQAIARNLARHHYKTSIYNKTTSKTINVLKKYPENIEGFLNLHEFVESLEKPRKILLMVSSNAVDTVLEELIELLDENDLIIDGGNSYYLDTERRMEKSAKKKIRFMGMGISGGEEGALNGPSIMPSGDFQDYLEVKEILENISAKVDQVPCVTYIGEKGSGHFVKMVHNGMEYAQMQLISEIYSYLRVSYSMEEIQKIWDRFNMGKMEGYLVKITADILKHKEKDHFLIDLISDVAESKGTGKWTSIAGLDYDVAIPSIISAMQARTLTHKKRFAVTKEYDAKLYDSDIEDLEKAYIFSMMIIYEQGFDLMRTASEKNQWHINLSNIATIWLGGCILQSVLLKDVAESFKKHSSLLLDPSILHELILSQDGNHRILKRMIDKNIYAPVMFSTNAYYEGLTHESLGTSLIQAQRDYFGAHTYQRKDREGCFHTEWKK